MTMLLSNSHRAPAGWRAARRGDVIAGAPPRAGQAVAPEEQGAQAAVGPLQTRRLGTGNGPKNVPFTGRQL